jgi:hypothetical protein
MGYFKLIHFILPERRNKTCKRILLRKPLIDICTENFKKQSSVKHMMVTFILVGFGAFLLQIQ